MNHIKGGFILLASGIITLAILVTALRADGLAGVSVGDYFLSQGSIPMPAIVANKEIKYVEPPKEKKPTKVTPKVEKKQEKPKEVKIDTKPDFDLDRLARAVAMAETNNCTKGYGKTHFNCHGIKSGNTYPCPGTPKGKMCKFKDKEESFIAFKVIWGKWYKTMPNLRTAKLWTGDDKKVSWLYNVNHHYEKL